MNEIKFTKGEWRVEGFVNGKGFEIAFNDDGEVIADYVYEESDAHLIAAAPKMYKFLDDIANGRGVDYPIEQLLKEARGE